MKKWATILLSGALFAEDLPFMEEEMIPSVEILLEEETVSTTDVIEQLYESEEPIEQVIARIKGNYIILDKGLVLAPRDLEYVQLFDEEDDVLVLKISEGYVLVHALTQVEVLCQEVGRVVEKDLSIAKILPDMLELSNGDLYSLEKNEECFWESKESVLIVKTDAGQMIMDGTFGLFEHGVLLGNLDKIRSLEFIQRVKGHHIDLVSGASLRSIRDDLGSIENWSSGDEVILQKFALVNIVDFDPFTPFILAHNVTKNEAAIVVLLTH